MTAEPTTRIPIECPVCRENHIEPIKRQTLARSEGGSTPQVVRWRSAVGTGTFSLSVMQRRAMTRRTVLRAIRPLGTSMKILVAIDDSMYSEAAIRALCEGIRSEDAEVLL